MSAKAFFKNMRFMLDEIVKHRNLPYYWNKKLQKFFLKIELQKILLKWNWAIYVDFLVFYLPYNNCTRQKFATC